MNLVPTDTEDSDILAPLVISRTTIPGLGYLLCVIATTLLLVMPAVVVAVWRWAL